MAIGKVRHQVRVAVMSFGQEIEDGKPVPAIGIPVIAVTANLTHLLILLMEVRITVGVCSETT